MTKYIAVYLPSSDVQESPAFDSRDECWEYIENLSRKCSICNNGEICESCVAEWLVDEVLI